MTEQTNQKVPVNVVKPVRTLIANGERHCEHIRD